MQVPDKNTWRKSTFEDDFGKVFDLGGSFKYTDNILNIYFNITRKLRQIPNIDFKFDLKEASWKCFYNIPGDTFYASIYIRKDDNENELLLPSFDLNSPGVEVTGTHSSFPSLLEPELPPLSHRNLILVEITSSENREGNHNLFFNLFRDFVFNNAYIPLSLYDVDWFSYQSIEPIHINETKVEITLRDLLDEYEWDTLRNSPEFTEYDVGSNMIPLLQDPGNVDYFDSQFLFNNPLEFTIENLLYGYNWNKIRRTPYIYYDDCDISEFRYNDFEDSSDYLNRLKVHVSIYYDLQNSKIEETNVRRDILEIFYRNSNYKNSFSTALQARHSRWFASDDDVKLKLCQSGCIEVCLTELRISDNPINSLIAISILNNLINIPECRKEIFDNDFHNKLQLLKYLANPIDYDWNNVSRKCSIIIKKLTKCSSFVLYHQDRTLPNILSSI